jgi:type II secretory pathway pseudopilin PulG
MTSPTQKRRTAGFTLYGVVIAMLLLGFALHPIVGTLATNTRIATDRQERLAAERVLRNEIAVLTAADPDAVAALRAYRVERTGRTAADGRFSVVTRRTVRCSVGGAPRDNASDPPPSGCSAGGVVHDYSITVTFPRSAGPTDTGSITRSFAVGASGPDGPPLGELP